jgi:hypothetical protein
MLYLACIFDWFSVRILWIAQRRRFHEFCCTKTRFDVHLLDFSIVDDDYDVHCFIIHWFDHRDESLRIIQSFDLLEITNHSSRFVTQNFVMFIFFDLVNSFVAKYSSIFKKVDQRSDLIDQKKFVFVLHDLQSFVLIWIVYRFLVWSSLKSAENRWHFSCIS